MLNKTNLRINLVNIIIMSSIGEMIFDIKDHVVDFGMFSYEEIKNSEGIVSSITNIGSEGKDKIIKIFNLVFGIKEESVIDGEELSEEIGSG